LKFETADLGEMIKTVLETFSRAFSEKAITVKCNLPDTPVPVRIDPDRITRVIRNLTDNAARYTPQNGVVEIKVESSPELTRIDYINTVDELLPEDLPYLFERFYRGEKSRSREHGGAGIGLSVSKKIIEAHGGRIWAESPDPKTGLGTKVSFSLQKVAREKVDEGEPGAK